MNNKCRIRLLPSILVNKIAAGEVVERPASVVKELIENAIDAGARRISIAIEEGGKQLIRVTDDGGGMSPEELRLSVMPHATSKIVEENDLYSINTLGFRGEALASISSVAKLRIASRLSGAEEGFEIRVAGEQVESARAAGCPCGTNVEVRDLFFNVPARRKFLKGNSTEVGHINEQVTRAALSHPGIGFELTNNGRVTQNLPPSAGRAERIAKFYGAELASALMLIERNERGIGLEVHVAPPSQSRATTNWQYTYVNGRFIRDRFIQHAVKEAHRGLMEPNRHGVVFLFLTVDPANVDVNVHPTKTEVRWADSGMIHSQVLSALREKFQQTDLTPSLRTDRAGREGAELGAAEKDRIRHEMADVLRNITPLQPGTDSYSERAGTMHVRGDRLTEQRYGSETPDAQTPAHETRERRPMATGDAEQMWRSLYATPESGEAESPTTMPGEPPTPTDANATSTRPKAIQLHNLYLVMETEDGIVIVDQHALHERVVYDQLVRRLTKGSLESQRLLLPESITVTPSESALLETNADLLHRLGIEVTPFGTDAVAVHSFPALLKDSDVVSFMRDLLDRLAEKGATADTEGIIHKLLDMMACKAAVKAGDPLSEREIEALMQHRHLIDKPSSCPHGRPTMLHLTKADLNRQFKRT